MVDAGKVWRMETKTLWRIRTHHKAPNESSAIDDGLIQRQKVWGQLQNAFLEEEIHLPITNEQPLLL